MQFYMNWRVWAVLKLRYVSWLYLVQLCYIKIILQIGVNISTYILGYNLNIILKIIELTKKNWDNKKGGVNQTDYKRSQVGL